MSYRVCVYLVPYSAIEQAALLGLLQRAAGDLDHPLERPPLYAVLTDRERAASDGTWQLMIATDSREDRYLVCEYFVEALSPLPHALLLHDDSSGEYVFRYYHPDTLFALASSGPFLYGNVERIEKPYAQKGYSHAELRALNEKPEAALSKAERAAVMEYSNAVSLGLRQFFPKPLRYLDLCDHERGFLLFHPKRTVKKPKEVALPPGWRGYVAAHSERDRGYAPPILSAETQAKRWAELGGFYDDPTQKIRCYQTSLERKPREPIVLYNLACAYATSGDRASMLETLRQACAVDPAQGAEALADADFAAFTDDAEFLGIVRPAPAAVQSDSLRARIRRIDWRLDPTPFRMSRVALIREFLRRMALWAEALSCKHRWPFFDVAAQAVPDSQAPELSSVSGLQMRVQATLSWMVHFEALSNRPHPELPNPYEPLLLFYERGGSFTVENKLIDVGMAAVPYADQERFRLRAALRSLDREHLAQLDRQGLG